MDETGQKAFDVKVSIEKDPVAHETLSLRAIFRTFESGSVPEAYYEYVRGEISKSEFESDPEIALAREKVTSEARLAELGRIDPDVVDGWISTALDGDRNWVLIGGPPCQAYSLAGRARMRRRDPEKFESDERHFLYREYLRVINRFSPAIFVMENVKGILTSSHSGSRIFQNIIRDLQSPRNGETYEIRSFVKAGKIDDPWEYVIESEKFGIPQSRHRVILLGIRSDIAKTIELLGKDLMTYVLAPVGPVSAGQVLEGLPMLRSRLSRKSLARRDSTAAWRTAIDTIARDFLANQDNFDESVIKRAQVAAKVAMTLGETGGRFIQCEVPECHAIPNWYVDPNIHGVTLHETRSHMEGDLGRYLFASSFAAEHEYSPKLGDFPRALLPAHGNVDSDNIPFKDRFRVQVKERPSSTVVSHIAKDGHYYIHYDPSQCRSLTVREAARLQTFPDNYFFEGTRTQQYHQVGNAVPPLLASKLAEIVQRIMKDGAR
jgi:DNA (cytosine-5)-methyltransferase 1